MSTQTASIPATPIKIHIPPTLRCYTIPLRSFLARNSTYDRLVGGGIEWTERKDADGTTKIRKWLKLSFEIEVAEIGLLTSHAGQQDAGDYLKSLPVEIDPEEHQDFAWVTKEEIRIFIKDGKGREIVSKEQAEKMLRAFEVREMGMEELMEEEASMRRY
ncbi:MAG: hypothetical protein Q9208_004788 [Pyrenodesmia sp. 3 TL-2023]